MATVTLRPGNTRDFEEHELEQLAAAIRDEAGVDVELEDREQRGYAVTWWEVMNFLLTETAGHVVDAVLAAAILWAKQRLSRKKQEDPDRRPRPMWVTVYGPDNEVLKSVKVTLPEDEPQTEDVTDDEQERANQRWRAEGRER